MAGLCGAIGIQCETPDIFRESISTFEGQLKTTYYEPSIEITYSDHSHNFEDQPAVADDILIWCWGDILGHEYKHQYITRRKGITNAEYCINLYDKYGTNFIHGLNSEFSGVIYNKNAKTISIFTDRLGSRPVYYTYTSDREFIFSSLLRSLTRHPDVDQKADPKYLLEFLLYSRVFGEYTPFAEIKKIPPASIWTFDLNGVLVDKERYWWPNPSSDSPSFKKHVEMFMDAFRQSVLERTSDNRSQGLLLSGGADSRLILGELGEDTISYHMNENFKRNNEARIAKEVAKITRSEFEYLERSVDYYPNLAKDLKGVNNLTSLFYHAHALGFADRIRQSVDELFCGHYSDTIFSDTYAPTQSGLFNPIFPPSRSKDIDSIEDYLYSMRDGDMGDSNDPIYWKGERNNVLEEHIVEKNGVVNFHGVPFPSWESLTQFGMIYPITNTRTHLTYESLIQMCPTRYPFLDNRIVDLGLKMPESERYKYDIVEAALSESYPKLATISHPRHKLPLTYPNYIKHWSSLGYGVWKVLRSKLSNEEKTTSIDNGGSWPNHSALIRSHSFIKDIIEANEKCIQESPHLDYDKVNECYESHLKGENNMKELYALATVLESDIHLHNT